MDSIVSIILLALILLLLVVIMAVLSTLLHFYIQATQTPNSDCCNLPIYRNTAKSMVEESMTWLRNQILVESGSWIVTFAGDGTLFYSNTSSIEGQVIRPLPGQKDTCPFESIYFDAQNGVLVGKKNNQNYLYNEPPSSDTPGPFQLILTPIGQFGITQRSFPFSWVWVFPARFVGQTQCFCTQLSGVQ